MAEDTTPAMGRLLGTNDLQRAIDKFDRTVSRLESVAQHLGGGGSGFSGGGTQGGGAANNGGGATFAGTAKDRYFNALIPPGGTQPPKQGGGAGNNGGRGGFAAGAGAFLGSLAASGRNQMSDQVTRDYVTQYARSVTGGGYGQTLRSLNGNSVVGNDGADRMGAGLIQTQTMGAANGSARWNGVRASYGQMGLLNPQMSGTQVAQAQADYSSGASYNGLQMYGIRTIGADGQRRSMGSIASQMASVTGLRPNQRFTSAQLAATFDSNISGYNQSLAAAVRSGSLTQDQADAQRQYSRNRAVAVTNGMSAADFEKYSTIGARQDSAGRDARKRLGAAHVDVTQTALQSMKNRVGAQENVQNNLTQGFADGVKTANDALSSFSNALTAVTNGPLGRAAGFGQGGAAVAGGGVSSFMHNPIVSGVSAYFGGRAISRLGARVLPRLFGGGASAGSGAGAAGAAGAGEAGAGAAGAAGTLGIAAIGTGAAAVGVTAGALYIGHQMSTHNPGYAAASSSRRAQYDATAQKLGYPSYNDMLAAEVKKGGLAGMDAARQLGGPAGYGQGGAADNGKNPSIQSGASGGGNAASIINIAKKYLGKPYHWGGSNPKSSFDCSGLMQWVFGQAGIKLPRTAAQQQKVGKPVAKTEVRPGDLVFWGNPAHHVAMVVGAGQIIEAPHTGTNIRIRKFSTSEITNARRVVGSVGNVGDLSNSQASGNEGGSQTGSVGGDIGNFFGTGSDESSVLASILSGGTPSSGGSAFGASTTSTASTTGSGADSGIGSAPSSVSGNAALGRKLAGGLGWKGKQWDALYQLWQGESGWNNKAQNPHSTAFGIAQFLDSTWGPYGSKTSDPSKQIQYGLSYIKDRYGDPVHAETFKKKHNWYDKGAWRIEGDQNAVVHDGEMVVPKADAETIRAALIRQPISQQKGSGRQVVLKFEPGSVVIQTSGTSDSAMRASAKQFVDYIAQDNRLKEVAAG